MRVRVDGSKDGQVEVVEEEGDGVVLTSKCMLWSGVSGICHFSAQRTQN